MKRKVNKTPFIVYTGLDGSGKSTRVEKSGLHWMKDNVDLNGMQSMSYWTNMYDQFEITDRFAPLDELVYSKVLNTPSKWSLIKMIEFIDDYSSLRPIEIRIGFNTFLEYSLVHRNRGEVDYPDYYKSFNEWVFVGKVLKVLFSRNDSVKLVFFHYKFESKDLDDVLKSLSDAVLSEWENTEYDI